MVDEFGNYVSGPEFFVTGAYECKQMINRDERVVYCGFLKMHWGHFLVDMVSRCWYFLENDTSVDKYVFIVDDGDCNRSIQGDIREFMRLLGIEKKLEIISEAMCFREVIVPEQSYKHYEYYSDQYNEMFNRVIKQALKETQGMSAYKKVFLSTKKFYRKAIGIEMLNAFFELNGYKVINPSDWTLGQRIYMLWNAEKIASQSGSWAHDLLFTKEKQRVIIMERFALNNTYQIDINRIKKFDAIHVDANLQFWPTTSGDGPHMFYKSRYFDEFVQSENLEVPAKKFGSEEWLYYVLKQYLSECGEITYSNFPHQKWDSHLEKSIL